VLSSPAVSLTAYNYHQSGHGKVICAPLGYIFKKGEFLNLPQSYVNYSTLKSISVYFSNLEEFT